MKKFDCCKGQYFQLCWLLSTVSWCLGASQEGWQSSAHSSSSFCVDTIVVVISSAMNNIICHMVQPCWRCFATQKSLTNHLLQCRLQKDQFYCRCKGASLQWWGIVIGAINFTVGTLASSRDCCRLWPSCSLWWGACFCLAQRMQP